MTQKIVWFLAISLMLSVMVSSWVGADEQHGSATEGVSADGGPPPEKEGPPLPLHGIEGMGGVTVVYSAYLANPARDGEIFALITQMTL